MAKRIDQRVKRGQYQGTETLTRSGMTIDTNVLTTIIENYTDSSQYYTLPNPNTLPVLKKIIKLLSSTAEIRTNRGSFTLNSNNSAIELLWNGDSWKQSTYIVPFYPTTQQGTKLIGTGFSGDSQQGISVSLSSDGNTLAVGGWKDDGAGSNAGATWIFTRSGTIWTQETKLVGTGRTGDSQQGRSVSLSSDGNTLAAGGLFDDGDGTNVGATWVFTRSGTVWTQQGTKLLGTGFTGNSSSQGVSVALSGDGNTLAVGADGDDGSGTDTGATWIFTRSGTIWTQQGTKLIGTGFTGDSSQGISVALSADGNTLAVGANGDDGNGTNVGATWVFTRNGTIWTQQGTKLLGTGFTGDSGQGISVALSADGNTLAVGADGDDGSGTNVGATWVFTRNSDVWTQKGTKLLGTGFTGDSQQGKSVSLSADGNTLAVGADGDDGSGTDVGAVWIFV